MIKVKNKEQTVNSAEYYYYIQSPDGTDYLFTENHVAQAVERARKNPEDIPSHYDNGFSKALVLGIVVGTIATCVVLTIYQQWFA